MINNIDYIYEIYKTGSFTKAAENLYVSQPALSLAIRKLEDKIGYPLFERRGKQTVPTEYGEKYIQAIKEIKRIQEDLENEISEISQLKSGRLRVGTTTFIANYLLPHIMKKFKGLYPSITVELFVEQSTVLKGKLECDELDIIIDNSVSLFPEMCYRPLFDEKILVGVPKESAVNERLRDCAVTQEDGKISAARKVDIVLLKDEDFILLKEGNSMREIATHIFGEAKIEPNVSMEFDSLLSSVRYAECGFGICLLTDTILKNRNTELCLYVPDTQFSSRTVYLIKKEKRYTSVATREFMRLVENETKGNF